MSDGIHVIDFAARVQQGTRGQHTAKTALAVVVVRVSSSTAPANAGPRTRLLKPFGECNIDYPKNAATASGNGYTILCTLKLQDGVNADHRANLALKLKRLGSAYLTQDILCKTRVLSNSMNVKFPAYVECYLHKVHVFAYLVILAHANASFETETVAGVVQRAIRGDTTVGVQLMRHEKSRGESLHVFSLYAKAGRELSIEEVGDPLKQALHEWAKGTPHHPFVESVYGSYDWVARSGLAHGFSSSLSSGEQSVVVYEF